MYHRLYCHIVWTTREREPLIDSGLARFLTRYLRTIARQERAHILEIGMVATHVHLLMRIDQGTSLPRLLQRLKGGSSYLLRSQPRRHAGEAIQDWSGDSPEYEIVGREDWRTPSVH